MSVWCKSDEIPWVGVSFHACRALWGKGVFKGAEEKISLPEPLWLCQSTWVHFYHLWEIQRCHAEPSMYDKPLEVHTLKQNHSPWPSKQLPF